MSEDVVNHPSHYAEGWSNGAEVIDITENLNFNRGNAVKYIARASKKNPEKELEDLQKAEFYLKREIQRIAQRWDNPPTYQVVAKPRVWESITEVPVVVRVKDKAGDLWEHRGGGWHWGSHNDGEFRLAVQSELTAYDYCAPFTEILEGSE